MPKPIYCLVSKDEEKRIRNFADTPEELAKIIGKNPASVRRAFARRRYTHTRNSQYEIIWEDGE